jgi:nucleoside-diphosphate-sugar epimerase
MFILGGTGFIGQEVVREAVDGGWTVRALARSGGSADALRAAGAEPVTGQAQDASSWAGELKGADVLIDLVQPPLPTRMGRSAVAKIVAQREAVTGAVLDALRSLPEGERPVLFSISGADDLEPDSTGTISERSSTRSELKGFARIGLPIHRLVAQSGLDATFVFFGVMVYGAGKAFADVYVDGLRKGRARIIGSGSNRLPIVHVTDAARALVHLAGLPREQIAGRTFVAVDGADTTQAQLLADTAGLMGVKAPGKAPTALVALIAGRAVAEAMTFDAHGDNSALRATGFEFRYPSHREGVPQVLEALGAAASGAPG